MKYEIISKGKYELLCIQTTEDRINELFDLEDLITRMVKEEHYHIAIKFLTATYLYSGAIRVLVNCYRQLESHGGSLSIIETNPSLYDILDLLNIGRVIKIYRSEDQLPAD